jgi:hypothetical protein
MIFKTAIPTKRHAGLIRRKRGAAAARFAVIPSGFGSKRYILAVLRSMRWRRSSACSGMRFTGIARTTSRGLRRSIISVQIATLAQAAARENKSILEYLSVIRSILMAQLVKQAEKGNARTAGQVSGYLITVLQTLGKITGEISELASATLTINNNSVHVLNSQPFVELQAGLLEVCQKHPDARGDIVDLFRRLDAKHSAPDNMKLIEAEPISRSDAIKRGQAAKREREAVSA